MTTFKQTNTTDTKALDNKILITSIIAIYFANRVIKKHGLQFYAILELEDLDLDEKSLFIAQDYHVLDKASKIKKSSIYDDYYRVIFAATAAATDAAAAAAATDADAADATDAADALINAVDKAATVAATAVTAAAAAADAFISVSDACYNATLEKETAYKTIAYAPCASLLKQHIQSLVNQLSNTAPR